MERSKNKEVFTKGSGNHSQSFKIRITFAKQNTQTVMD